MKYKIILETEVEVEAENIVQALDSIKELRMIGSSYWVKWIPSSRCYSSRRVCIQDTKRKKIEKINE